jgi:4-amino-4-deoxy-L-arabinose transferase-like glycosyltransferase
MSNRQKETLVAIACILGIGILFFVRLGYLPILFEEPRRALVALEMMMSGNYWVPQINSFEYYNKPPVYNWLLVVLFKLFGTAEWVVRLPTVLSLIGLATVHVAFFRDKIGFYKALYSALFWLLSAHVLFYFSFQGEIDIFYTFVTYCQILCLLHFGDKRAWHWMFLTSYLFMAIGVLTKGLPSIAFQGCTLLGLSIYFKDWRYAFHPTHVLGFGLGFGMIFAYFFKYSEYANPWAFISQLLFESSKRTSSGGLFAYVTNLVRVPGELLKITFPWCLILLFWSRSVWREIKSNKWVTLFLIFIVSNIWLYLISPGTRDRYLYPFLPFLYTLVILNLPADTLYKRKFWLFLFGIILSLGIITMGVLSKFLISGLVIGLLMLLVTWLIGRDRLNPFVGLFAIMILARVGYDQTIFPTRLEDEFPKSGSMQAQKLLDLTKGQRLYFLSAIEQNPIRIPFVKMDGYIETIDRLPFKLSYYFSRARMEPIVHTKVVRDGNWHVCQLNIVPEGQKVAYSFNLENKEWVVFKAE